MQTLELNWVCINNAQCTWWPSKKKLQQRNATEELSITWCSRDLKSFKGNSKIQFWFSHVLDYNSWLLRNFLKSCLDRSPYFKFTTGTTVKKLVYTRIWLLMIILFATFTTKFFISYIAFWGIAEFPAHI